MLGSWGFVLFEMCEASRSTFHGVQEHTAHLGRLSFGAIFEETWLGLANVGGPLCVGGEETGEHWVVERHCFEM